MNNKQKPSSVYLGEKTKDLIDSYATKNDISRSAVIKLAVNEFLRNR